MAHSLTCILILIAGKGNTAKYCWPCSE